MKKLHKSLKNNISCCKLEILFKSKTILRNKFHLKDRIPKGLTSYVPSKFQKGRLISTGQLSLF